MTAAHVPTEITRAEVSALVSYGVTGVEISKFLDIDEKTFLKHYRREIDSAHIRANASVARKLYEKAVLEGDTTACIFWLKTRARWRERDPKEDENNHNIGDILKQFGEMAKELAAKHAKEY
jgi:hypothetical protein